MSNSDMTPFLNNKVRLKGVVLFYLFFFTGTLLFSQETVKDSGSIQLIQDEKVDLLVSKHILINQNRQGMNGYRIQIFFDSGTNSKIRARSVYDNFLSNYANTGAYLTFKAPNYKVRVGDFRTRLDAQRFLNEIIADYPNAWIIEDQINLPKVEF
jgi:hypothetical protein